MLYLSNGTDLTYWEAKTKFKVYELSNCFTVHSQVISYVAANECYATREQVSLCQASQNVALS